MLNLLLNIRELAYQIPLQRKRAEEAIAELHAMELRMMSLSNQVSYERSAELLEERLRQK